MTSSYQGTKADVNERGDRLRIASEDPLTDPIVSVFAHCHLALQSDGFLIVGIYRHGGCGILRRFATIPTVFGLGFPQLGIRCGPYMRYIHDPQELFKRPLQFSRGVGCFEEDVPVHPYVESVADRNLDGWLNT